MKKTARKKQDNCQHLTTNRHAGADGLLQIAARLKDQVWRADPGPSRKERVYSILARKKEDGKLPDFDSMTSSEKIMMMQYLRDAYGQAPFDKESTFYQIVTFAWDIANTNPDQAKLLREISRMYGTAEDELWPDLDDETPEAIRELRVKREEQLDQLIAAVLRKHDEDEAADLLMNDSAAFWNRYDQAEEAWEKSLDTGA